MTRAPHTAVALSAARNPACSPHEAHFSPLSPRGRGLGSGGSEMKRVVSHERAHAARGSNFLLLRQKKVTKEKATPTFALIRDLERKRRAVRNSLRSNNEPLHRRFHSKYRGRMSGGPFQPILIAARFDCEKTDASIRVAVDAA